MPRFIYTATFSGVVNVPDHAADDAERWIAHNILWGEELPDGVDVEPVREEGNKG